MSIQGSWKEYIRAKKELAALTKAGPGRPGLNKFNEPHENAPVEVMYLLMDYQNRNEVLARKVMSRYKANILNKRMEGTGMGWNQRGGY